ncbi:MAG: DNA methyltransferase [Lysobacteraceae bacterium]
MMCGQGLESFSRRWPVHERTIKPSDGSATSDPCAFQPYAEGADFGPSEGIDADVSWIKQQYAELPGYPTQKPLALLERMVNASSNPGDVVFDKRMKPVNFAADSAARLRGEEQIECAKYENLTIKPLVFCIRSHLCQKKRVSFYRRQRIAGADAKPNGTLAKTLSWVCLCRIRARTHRVSHEALEQWFFLNPTQ